MKLFTADEMRTVDRATTLEGIPALLLMEAAGRESARDAVTHFPDAQRILVLCGSGNNGGDGYAAARFLRGMGRSVAVLELSSEPATEESRSMRAAWLAHGGQVGSLGTQSLESALGTAGLIIDALFGCGLSRPLAGPYAALVETLNVARVPIFSIDVPSGIQADRTAPVGPSVHATRTLQLAGPKLASVFSPAREAFGPWTVADIGIPRRLLDAGSTRLLLDSGAVRPWLPCRPRETHKYRVGTVLVVAGSPNYAGAAELACRAALRAGAGLVTLAAEQRPAGGWPEIVFEELDWDKRPLDALTDISGKRAQIRVVGPGLDTRALRFLPDIIRQSGVPTVLDAGALENSEAWFEAVRAHGRCVLTPHAGEASHLLGVPAFEIASDPLAAASELAQRTGAVAVLKGATTVIASPDGRLAVNTCSHPGMATAGSGDVLSGLLGGWLAGAENLFERAAATVYMHGAAGVRAAARFGDGLIAGDLVETFAGVWHELAHGDKLPGL